MWYLACLVMQGPSLVLEPAEVQVGEPVCVSVDIDHPVAAGPLKESLDLHLDDQWVLLAGPSIEVGVVEGGHRTQVIWSVMALEAGTQKIAGLEVAMRGGGSQSLRGAELRVVSSLAPEEDAPRPLPDLRGSPERLGPLRASHWGLLALGALVGGALWSVIRGRRSRVDGMPPLNPRQRFIELRQRIQDPSGTSSLPGEWSGDLAGTLRLAVEQGSSLGSHRSTAGLSDEEWLAVLSEGGGRSLAESLEPVLSACARIRFGAERPTRFAVDELLQASAQVIDSLGDPTSMAAGGVGEGETVQ